MLKRCTKHSFRWKSQFKRHLVRKVRPKNYGFISLVSSYNNHFSLLDNNMNSETDNKVNVEKKYRHVKLCFFIVLSDVFRPCLCLLDAFDRESFPPLPLPHFLPKTPSSLQDRYKATPGFLLPLPFY